MAEVVFLHIGAMKSGTTFLQSLMSANKSQLLAAGCLFPGASWLSQVRAAQDIVGAGKDPRLRAASAGAWEVLVREIAGHPGAAVVSMEFLSFAGSRRVRRMLASLAGTEVHLVLTVRDATATIPAHWQDLVRNGSTVSRPEFSRAVVRSTGRHHHLDLLSRDDALRKFSQAQDLERILQIWSPHLRRQSYGFHRPPPAHPRLAVGTIRRSGRPRPARVHRAPASSQPVLGSCLHRTAPPRQQEPPRSSPFRVLPTLKNYLAARVLSQRTGQDDDPTGSTNLRLRPHLEPAPPKRHHYQENPIHRQPRRSPTTITETHRHGGDPSTDPASSTRRTMRCSQPPTKRLRRCGGSFNVEHAACETAPNHIVTTHRPVTRQQPRAMARAHDRWMSRHNR